MAAAALSDIRFDRFDFGYAEAKFELEQAPRLLRAGYFDLGSNEQKILNGHEFLVLGYKGSGKSAIGARLQVLANDSPAAYLVPPATNVADLPLDNFREIVPKAFDALQRYQHSWSLLLLSSIVLTAAKDGGASTKSGEGMREAARLLIAEGVELGSPATLRKLRTAKVESKLTLPRFYERTHTLEPSRPENAIRIWLAYLESICETFESQRKHYYFFDGLDDMRVLGDGRNLLLAGLLQSIERLNEVFRGGSAPLKVVLACRTDVYGRIDSARGGKLRRDFAVEMDWYQNPRDARHSYLMKLATRRAKLMAPNVQDLLQSFFPQTLLGRPVWETVIEQTRHTPRDVLQLLKIIGKHATAPGRLSEQAVLGGFAEYSDTYFTDEAHDAMRFYFDETVRSRAMELLGTLRRRTFTPAELRAVATGDPRFKRVDVDELVTVLFDNGFLGNKTPGGATGTGPDYYRFKYRSARASLRWDEELVVHFGLWKALNIA